MRQYSCGDCKYYKKIGENPDNDFGYCKAPVPSYVFTTDDEAMLLGMVFINGGRHDYGDDCDCFERGE